MKMSAALKGVSVLVVEDDPDTLDLLFLTLGAVGADLKVAGSAEAALAILETWRPDVILSDLQLPGADGFEFLALLRANPRLRSIPAVALTGVPSAIAEGEKRVAFEKYMTKPSKLPEIVIAIATLASHDRPEVSPPRPSAELRSVLARLNAASGCRYTSLLRFVGDTLTSIWTYDRDRPKTDPFPLGLPVHASYCVLVRDAREMYVIENAATDARVATHPKRNELARYIGVPLVRSDGTMLGTLCCYDPQPRAIPESTRAEVQAAAKELEPWLEVLFQGADEVTASAAAGARKRA